MSDLLLDCDLLSGKLIEGGQPNPDTCPVRRLIVDSTLPAMKRMGVGDRLKAFFYGVLQLTQCPDCIAIMDEMNVSPAVVIDQAAEFAKRIAYNTQNTRNRNILIKQARSVLQTHGYDAAFEQASEREQLEFAIAQAILMAAIREQSLPVATP